MAYFSIKNVILLAIITLPLYSLGIFVGNKFISQSHLMAIFVAMSGTMVIVKRNMVVPRSVLTWTKPFIAFLCVCLIGMLTSPYGPVVLTKGGIQIVGILIMIVMGVAISMTLHEDPRFILRLARTASISLGVVAIIGCFQFILWNLTPFHHLLTFDFMNSIEGGSVWRYPGTIGPLHRINSIAAEPTAFSHYLGFSLGWSLIRLGLLGRGMRVSISRIIPLWSAVVSIIAFALSISMNAWILMALTAFMLLIGAYKIKLSRVVKAVPAIIAVGIVFFIVLANTNGALESKFQTVKLISGGYQSADRSTMALSALAVAANISVAVQNFSQSPMLGGGLGSHPIAYDKFAPNYVADMHGLKGLNKDDAASLFLRLLSETGIVGLILFVGGMGWLILRARKAVLYAMDVGLYDSAYIAVAAGVIASTAGLFISYLIRTGHYYDPEFWILISLVASIPMILYEKITQEIKIKQLIVSGCAESSL